MSGGIVAFSESRRLGRRNLVSLAVVLTVAGLFSAPPNLAGQDGSNKPSQPPSPETRPPINDAREIDEPPPGKSQLHRLLDESADRYSLYAGDDRAEPMKLKCVLRWANLTRGSVDGATYIWTKDGRPMATVCVYPWAGLVCDNFQSLSEGKIAAFADGGEVWRCEKPGVAFRPVPGAQGDCAMIGTLVYLGGSDSRRASTTVAGEWSRSERSLSHVRFDVGAIAGSLCRTYRSASPRSHLPADQCRGDRDLRGHLRGG